MAHKRRDFIRKAILVGCGTSGSVWLSGCTKDNGVGPFRSVEICSTCCVGCGDCIDTCAEAAIVLPQPSHYTIDTAECTSCGICQPVCEPGAIRVATVVRSVDRSRCVGCGDCLEACRAETGAITWGREHYTVLSTCLGNHCERPCLAACPRSAISISGSGGGGGGHGGRVVIDLTRCDRCGECVAACPYGAIAPAYVTLDQLRCSSCGKCEEVCRFDAIRVARPDTHFDPSVDQDLCDQCGQCLDVCPRDAILAELHAASIDRDRCTGCGACVETCRYDAIRQT